MLRIDTSSAIGPSLKVVVLGRVISGVGGAGMGSLVSILIPGMPLLLMMAVLLTGIEI